MKHRTMHAPLAAYMLADHLDAALAAGEDLMTCGAQWCELAESAGEPSLFAIRQRALAEDIRSLELILVARILQARGHALSVADHDDRFTMVAKLFASGTAILLDAVEESGDARSADFDSGDGLIAYVRSRGLIAPDAADIRLPADLAIDDNFLVAKRMALGPLLDMAAAFLDALDVQYDLFVEDEPAAKAKRFFDLEESDRIPLN
jgi:hypothetical protein